MRQIRVRTQSVTFPFLSLALSWLPDFLPAATAGQVLSFIIKPEGGDICFFFFFYYVKLSWT